MHQEEVALLELELQTRERATKAAEDQAEAEARCALCSCAKTQGLLMQACIVQSTCSMELPWAEAPCTHPRLW